MLKPDTERVWTFLKDQPALAGFVLLGGSALAMHLHHRLSEDLDFVFSGPALPRARLEALRRTAATSGLELTPHDDPAALQEFVQGGMELRDYQQDYLANGAVKVSFFAPDPPLLAVLEKHAVTHSPRVATLAELFRSKSLITSSRSKTRDWFDLFVLMTRCGYSLHDYHEAFRLAGLPDQAALGLQRLCSGQPQTSDEGFERLAAGAPGIEEMRRFFQAQRDAFERSEAARAWKPPKP